MMVRNACLWLALSVTPLWPQAGLFAADQAPNGQPSSLCRVEERVFFNCSVAGSGKIISLCGSKSLDHRRGYLQYRYGKPGAIELQYPQDRANTQIAFRYAHYFRAQVDRTEISFDNQGYRYTLFDYFEADIKPAVATAGVRVGRHRTKERKAELQCSGKALNQLSSLETVIPRDPDNALNQ